MWSFQLNLSHTPSIFEPNFLSSSTLKFTPHFPSPPPVASSLKSGISISQSLEAGAAQNGTSTEKLSDSLPAGLRRELMPTHVAVIMDGNRRWAQIRGLPIGSGYEAGVRALKRLMELCCKWRIEVLTVFALSSNNWLRPKVEIDFLMGLLERGLRDELENLDKAGIRISLIGDSTKLPKSLQVLIADSVEVTKRNSKLHFIMAVNYSGQNDIVQACQSIARKVKDGIVNPDDVDEFLVERELGTNCTNFPSPDLLIRTSGELRISNFFLWQLAFTELYFARSHWPDFGEDEFLEALCSFQQRQRRYGRRSS